MTVENEERRNPQKFIWCSSAQILLAPETSGFHESALTAKIVHLRGFNCELLKYTNPKHPDKTRNKVCGQNEGKKKKKDYFFPTL